MSNRFVLALLTFTSASSAADLPIYLDGPQGENGFQNFSYATAPATPPSFVNPAPVRTGTASIALTPRNFNAVSLAHPTSTFTQSQYVGVKLWVHGGATGAQQLSINVYESPADTTPVQAALSAYLAAPIAANTWQPVEVRFADAPLSYTGTFSRIELQDGGTGAPQGTVYFDDVVLIDAAPPATIDPIFANGFEGDAPPPAPANALLAEPGVVDADVGCTGDRFTWQDASGAPRVAVLAHNTGQTCPGGSRGGELRLLKYAIPGGTRVVRAAATGAGGFGYVVSHRGEGTTGIGADDSPLGHGFTGTFTRVFTGRHHALLRFEQRYPRYSRTTATPANTRYDVPVTVDWLIATGRDDPLWSITYDTTGATPGAVPANALNDDSRSPYGELLFDGAATPGAHSVIAGVGWGDRYKFTTTTAPVTYNSAWTWNAANTVPYVKLWTTAVDATMGTVQTQTIVQHDAGGYYGTHRWNTTSAAGNACTVASGGVNTLMPCNYNWPYQSINYSMDPFANPNAPTNNTRLAWGTNFGFLGRTSYPVHGSSNGEIGGPVPGAPTASGWPRQSYAAFVVLGRHTQDPVGRAVTLIETVQRTSVTTAIGTVATSALAGPNRADFATLEPAGWDPYTAAWTFDGVGNALDASFTLTSGTLAHPMLVIRNWSGDALPSAVRVNGASLVRDVDYFPSAIDGIDRLYLTFNRDFAAGATRVEIVP